MAQVSSRDRCRVGEDSLFSRWLDGTTIHGVYHVFKTPSFVRKSLWGIVFAVATLSLLSTIIIRFLFFLSFSIATTVFLETDLREIVFPSVTICNLNPVRYSYAEQNNLTQLVDFFYNSIGANSTQCSSILEDIGSASNKPIRDILFEGRSLLDDFVVDCTFLGSDQSLFSCKQNLSLTLTRIGYCYSFNSDMTAEAVTVSNSGARYGLQLILDIQQEEYLPVLSAAGVRIAIQPRGVPPEPDERGVLVPPGEQALIQLRAQEIEDNSFVRTCEPADTPLSFFSGYNYSLATCRLQATYQKIADDCQCLGAVDNKQAITTLLDDCRVFQACCLHNASFNTDESQCTESCDYTEFITRTSYVQFPSNTVTTIGASRLNVSADRIKNNVAAVNIFFGDPHTRKIVTENAFSFSALLSNIGGQLGLFLGASIISMIELGWFTFDELLAVIKKCCFKK